MIFNFKSISQTFLVVILIGCNIAVEKDAGIRKSRVSTKDSTIELQNIPQPNAYQNLLDSISAGLDLSLDQIARETRIDSLYIRTDPFHSDPEDGWGKQKFRGDTVYFREKAYSLAIVDHSDGLVCSKKLLLVFETRTLQNTDYMEVQTDCDIDESSSYGNLTYKITSDTSFITTDVFYKKTKNGHNKSVEKKLWKVREGKIEPKHD